MVHPLFSFVIPVYNVEQYLKKCLDSILAQKFDDWEALLIDDGSKDLSGKICDEYAVRDSRFRVFHKPNGGVSSARNMALENAHGEWIWFVDPDDWIETDALSVLNKAISANDGSDLVLFGIRYFDETYLEIGIEWRQNINDKSKEATISPGDYPPQNYLIKSKLVSEYNLRFSNGIATGEDLEFQCKYFMICNNPISIDKILYGCLRRRGSAMHNPKTIENMAKDSPRILNNLVEFIKEYGITEADWLAARINRTFKAAMSANYIEKKRPEVIQATLRNADNALRALGFHKYRDMAVKAGVLNVRLYYLVQTLRALLKR